MYFRQDGHYEMNLKVYERNILLIRWFMTRYQIHKSTIHGLFTSRSFTHMSFYSNWSHFYESSLSFLDNLHNCSRQQIY